MGRVLILGASGGIGSALASACAARGDAVTGLSRSRDGFDVTDEASVSAHMEALEGAFDMAVVGVGHFAKKGLPKALWAATDAKQDLSTLQSRTERACRRAGCQPETRKFVPHVTIARLNRSTGSTAGWMAKNGDLRTDSWRVDSFILYESHLGAGGSHYEPVMRYSLMD